MTSKVIEGHKRYSLYLKMYFFQGGTLAHRLSPNLPSPSLSLSMPFYLFSLSLGLLLSFSFFPPSPPPSPLNHPLCLFIFIFSLSLVLLLSIPFFTSSPLHRPYIHPMNLHLFSLPRSSSPFFFNLNLRSYGQLFVLITYKIQYLYV